MSAREVYLRTACASRFLFYRSALSSRIVTFNIASVRSFSNTRKFNMPETLHASEVNSRTDPSVAKQYDNETPKDQQVKEFFEIADGQKICMLNTYRKGVGEWTQPPEHNTSHSFEHQFDIHRTRWPFHGSCQAKWPRLPFPCK